MPEITQRSFTSGEIAPALRSRADLVKYATGLALCQNFMVRPQGGVYSRPGTRYIAGQLSHSARARLIPFSFNTEQTYMLVFENLKMRVIKDGGLVVSAAKTITGATQANPVEITATAHGYTTGDTVSINAIVGMTELNGKLYQLTSTGANTFTLDGIDGTGYTAYTSGGTSEKVFELTTPYTTAQLPRLVFAQSADVMTITHPSHNPYDLSRTAHDVWTITTIDYSPIIDVPIFSGALAYTITNITTSNPVTVSISFTPTAAGFFWLPVLRPVNVNNEVIISGVVGTTQLNGEVFEVGAVNAYDQIAGTETFTLRDVDGTAFGAYVSGGTNTMGGGGVSNAGDPAGGGTYYKTYRYVVTAVNADGIESLPSAESSINCKSLSTTYGVRLQWANVTGADHYRIYKDPSNNTDIYGWIGDSKNSNFIDYNKAPLTSDAPQADRQPFTAANDKPAVNTYYQQRQVFANTNNEPQTLFATQTANRLSFRLSTPAKDDDSITQVLFAQQVNEIRHLVPLDALILLTSGGEWIMTEGKDSVMTPATVGFKPQSYNGSSWVPPVVINSTALYVQEKGTRIRDLGYEFSSDKYTGNDLSLMSEHLFEGHTIDEMTFAAEPYGIVWCARSDGKLLGLTYQREHQVWGWHQHDLGGVVESIATISEDGRDAVYMTVKRVVNGSTVRYIERMEPRFTANVKDSFFVDSGLTLDVPITISGATQANPVVVTATAHGLANGDIVDIDDVVGMTELNGNRYKVANKATNTFELTDYIEDTNIDGTAFTAYIELGDVRLTVTTINGLDHLEGKAVAVLADGNEVEEVTVASGSITIPTAASRVHVGLSYIPAIELLDVDIPAEALKPRQISVSRVTIEVEASRGGWVGPINDFGEPGRIREIKPRFESDNYDTMPLRSFKQDIHIEPMWEKSGAVRIEQRSPLPISILSVIPDVSVGG